MKQRWFAGTVGAVIAWVAILGLTAVIGSGLQWLWFAEAGDPPAAWLLRWPILWPLYFFLSHSVVENLARLLPRAHE